MSHDRPCFVSIIIPTYNRRQLLARALESLSRQTYPVEHFEVIVVDDGSSDGTADAITHSRYPFELRYLHHVNQGATVARNHGADHSQGECLVFMDDDIVPGAAAIAVLAHELTSRRRTIILGKLGLPSQITARSLYSSIAHQDGSRDRDGGLVPFQECMTGLMAIRKSDFVALGKFEDPTGGWPNWDDVDFGYRASEAGFQFWRSAAVLAEHWDYAATNLGEACRRWYRASKSAPWLFRRHPALAPRIPMFRDKGPIAWRQDPLALIVRKLARQIASSRLALCCMERLAGILEARFPSRGVLARLYRWIASAYIYRGYREGLRIIGCDRIGTAE